MQMTICPTHLARRWPVTLLACISICAGCDAGRSTPSVLAEDVVIQTLAGFTPLISAGTTLPAAFEDGFSTSEDNQPSVTLRLYAGNGASRRDLAVFVIDGIMPAPKGIPRIRVKLDVSPSGKATIRAVDQTSQASKELDLGQLVIRDGE